jgi:hypothetical protein
MSYSVATRLAEAQNALHLLVTGRQARVVVDQNGERVEFTMTSVSQLQAYIASLQAEGSPTAPTGPLKFIF